jgi:hypothetical protein
MQYLKPYTTLAVGVVLGWLILPRVVRMVHK